MGRCLLVIYLPLDGDSYRLTPKFGCQVLISTGDGLYKSNNQRELTTVNARTSQKETNKAANKRRAPQSPPLLMGLHFQY